MNIFIIKVILWGIIIYIWIDNIFPGFLCVSVSVFGISTTEEIFQWRLLKVRLHTVDISQTKQ